MITVLMATYQGEKYLEQQLDSILSQTVPVRILVSDDGSDDGTREMLGRYQQWYPKQVFLKHRAACAGKTEDWGNGVPPAAQNFFWLMSQAAREGKSDYIMLSDQDDVWFNCKVKRLLARMKQLEEELGTGRPILVHSDMEVVDESLRQIHSSFFAYQHCDPERVSFAEVLVENPVTGGALMMNRALLKLVAGGQGKCWGGNEPGMADAQATVKLPASCYMHDWWIALAASCFGTVSCVEEPLYQYRQHGANTLGARATGSLADLRARPGRRRQVKENYGRMFAQAVSFGRRYGKRMGRQQKDALRAFLALPYQSPPERMRAIRENHLYKSSLPQILAMCVTMPRARKTPPGRGRHES